MHAVSHSSGTSSGWLKALPQPSLGLAFSPHDFNIALSLWLGISLFPFLPLCTCFSTIDQFGDHLLSCFHGLLRIQHHDALVSVVHHNLLQDHPGVLCEQDTSISDCFCPGDIYYPNFHLDTQLTSTSQFGARLSLLLFPLLLLRLGWLQLLMRRLKTISISILLTSLEVISFHLLVNPLVYGCHPLCPPYFQWLTDQQSKMVCPAKLLGVSCCSTLWHYNVRMICRQYTLFCDDDLVFSL